jgi:hypothetical protein
MDIRGRARITPLPHKGKYLRASRCRQARTNWEGHLLHHRQRIARIKAYKQVPRPRQHHYKCRQTPFFPAELNLTEICPVHLSLFARQGTQSQVSILDWLLPIPRHNVAKVINTARIASGFDHLINPCGGESRIVLQRLLDEPNIRISN